MPVPDYKKFSRLAGEATLIPIVKSVPADLLTTVSAFLAVAGDEQDAFLLESVERGEQIGRYTFVGARPYMQIRAHGDEITVQQGKRTERRQGNVFQIVKEELKAAPSRIASRPAAVYRRSSGIFCLRHGPPAGKHRADHERRSAGSGLRIDVLRSPACLRSPAPSDPHHCQRRPHARESRAKRTIARSRILKPWRRSWLGGCGPRSGNNPAGSPGPN